MKTKVPKVGEEIWPQPTKYDKYLITDKDGNTREVSIPEPPIPSPRLTEEEREDLRKKAEEILSQYKRG